MFSQIIFVGGKGGVGKSTISSSLACNLSSQGKKTLLISTDPAHNLSDLFQVQLSNSILSLNPQLSILEIDPIKEAKHYTQKIAKENKAFVGASSYEMLDRYYKSASENATTQESALFDRLISLITQELSSWDHFIIDTAPTGHTLRLFTLAQTLKTWSKTLLKYQQKNMHFQNILDTPSTHHKLLNKLQDRYEKYAKFQGILQDPKLCSIVFVLNPDYLCIEETKRAIALLQNIQVHALAINKIAPLGSESFFENRYKIQEKYLQRIRSEFHHYKQWNIPLLDCDILQETQIKGLLEEIFEKKTCNFD
ncbi:ArsA family ATPase [Helicobacter cholecystus]|uniref:ArsA family ATPase n=1 Tax=Helicobacter cholecystus TaxID=45498 RepID=UPI00273A27D3|nr:ArsA family ATPase [Helicobacter cholecystus]